LFPPWGRHADPPADPLATSNELLKYLKAHAAQLHITGITDDKRWPETALALGGKDFNDRPLNAHVHELMDKCIQDLITALQTQKAIMVVSRVCSRLEHMQNSGYRDFELLGSPFHEKNRLVIFCHPSRIDPPWGCHADPPQTGCRLVTSNELLKYLKAHASQLPITEIANGKWWPETALALGGKDFNEWPRTDKCTQDLVTALQAQKAIMVVSRERSRLECMQTF
jgi:hypothetical protein